MKLFDSTKIPLLSRALSAYSLRQKVTSANIANIDTAGYRSKYVSFSEEMDAAERLQPEALATTNELHFATGATSQDESGVQVGDAAADGIISNDPYASGVNNVDIDHEMAELAQTQMRFKYAARLLTDTFRNIQNSIRGQS